MLWKIIQYIFGAKPTAKSFHILVIDDNPVDQKVICSALERGNYQVSSALDGKSGFEMAKTAKPDLIILDYNLPDTIGPEVCKLIKTHALTRHIPVLFLTWMDTPGSIINVYDHQAENYIVKPVNQKYLIQQVEQTLQERKSEK